MACAVAGAFVGAGVGGLDRHPNAVLRMVELVHRAPCPFEIQWTLAAGAGELQRLAWGVCGGSWARPGREFVAGVGCCFKIIALQ